MKDCLDCKFFDGLLCMYNCDCKFVLGTENQAENCNHYKAGQFDWDELEKSNYK